MPLTITNSTLSGNAASGAGSGIYNGGTLAVRGLVAIDGDYFQTATGTLAVRIGGLQAGTDYDQLAVNGLAALGGTLDVQLVNGFQPQFGDLFQPLLFAQGSGTFRYYTGDASRFGPLYVYDPNPLVPTGLLLVAAGDAGSYPSTDPSEPVLPLWQASSVNADQFAFSYPIVPAFDFATGLTLVAA
jgi:hypothetical protein